MLKVLSGRTAFCTCHLLLCSMVRSTKFLHFPTFILYKKRGLDEMGPVKMLLLFLRLCHAEVALPFPLRDILKPPAMS